MWHFERWSSSIRLFSTCVSTTTCKSASTRHRDTGRGMSHITLHSKLATCQFHSLVFGQCAKVLHAIFQRRAESFILGINSFHALRSATVTPELLCRARPSSWKDRTLFRPTSPKYPAKQQKTRSIQNNTSRGCWRASTRARLSGSLSWCLGQRMMHVLSDGNVLASVMLLDRETKPTCET